MKWSNVVDAFWPPIQVAAPSTEGMTFPEAVARAGGGARIRRRTWSGWHLEASYSGMYLSSIDNHRYAPTIEEILATDWELL
jgi:hypothetical protein